MLPSLENEWQDPKMRVDLSENLNAFFVPFETLS